MRVAVFALLLLVSGSVIYTNLFARKRVMKEISKGNYLKALYYSKYCPEEEKRLTVLRLIRNDFRAIYSNLEMTSERELDLLIDYMEVLSLRPEVYLNVIERVREVESARLTRKLKSKIDKPAWENILKQDLKTLKNAE